VIVIAFVLVVGAAAYAAIRRERREAGRALADVGADTGGIRRKPAPEESTPTPESDEAPLPGDAPPEQSGPPPATPSTSPPPDEKRAPAPPQPTVAVELPDQPDEPKVAGGTMMIEWHGSLVVTDGELKGKRYTITSEGFYIGRDEEMSQVVVDDSRISRRHVWVGAQDGEVVAIDQGSTNGTFVNGERIEKTTLKEGDTLVLADRVIVLEYEP
ncbi:MAG: FHA domain-containing protein, partial [Thermoanaerobaculia bacterium]|nr:FHA domain-containing protein [Thermoanaerobaculia bacterium]